MPTEMPDAPIETNILKGYQYKFDISIFPHVSYHSQSVQLPSVSIDSPIFATPHRDLNLPGTKMTFDPITLTFLVDDNLNNWKEVYYWMLKMTFDKAKYKEFNSLQADGTLHILNGDLTPKTIVKFVNLHPTSLSELSFDSTQTDPDPQVAFITMEYDYFIFDGDEQL